MGSKSKGRVGARVEGRFLGSRLLGPRLGLRGGVQGLRFRAVGGRGPGPEERSKFRF